MGQKWYVKADTTTSIILWIGITTSVLIMVIWYARVIYPNNALVSYINSDLETVQSHFNSACNSEYYRAKVNPVNEKGNYTLANSSVCINTQKISKCRTLICNPNLTLVYDLSNMTYLVIQKGEVFNVTKE